jgi:hypothetical protein
LGTQQIKAIKNYFSLRAILLSKLPAVVLASSIKQGETLVQSGQILADFKKNCKLSVGKLTVKEATSQQVLSLVFYTGSAA